MQFRLDRSLPIALPEQIKGQITYAISYGLLLVGESLPSVRELASTLNVAPMTISRVYRDLAQQGLVVSKPGVGTFVADLASADPGDIVQNSHANLQQVIDTCLREALLLGHTVDDIRAAFLHRLERYRTDVSVRRVLLVGNFQAATAAYAREIEAILHDLSVQVIPVLLQDLKDGEGDLCDALKGIGLAITLPTRLHEVREMLEPHGCHVVAVAFQVNAETRRRLAAISSTQRVGIVSTYPEFLQTIVDTVALYGLLRTPPECALLGQPARLQEMLSRIDVLVCASGSESVLERLPDHVEAFEFRHAPEPDSVNRLRPLIL